MSSTLLLSVGIPSFNCAQALQKCLDGFCKQTAPHDTYEIIVVDNNSSDDSFNVASSYTTKLPHLRVYRELKPGLSNVRNKILSYAQGQYVGYIDGDGIPESNWVAAALQFIKVKTPDIFGGRVKPYFDREIPRWFKEGNQKYLVKFSNRSSGDPINKDIKLKNNHAITLFGNNIFFKRALLEGYGGFSPHLGMAKDSLHYHEESAIVFRALQEHRVVYYHKDITISHLVKRNRLCLLYYLIHPYKNAEEMRHLIHAGLLTSQYAHMTERELLLAITSTTDQMVASLEKAMRHYGRDHYPFLENILAEQSATYFSQLGNLVSAVKLKLPTHFLSPKDTMSISQNRFTIQAFIFEVIRAAKNTALFRNIARPFCRLIGKRLSK